MIHRLTTCAAIDPALHYSVGREDRTKPWVVYGPGFDADYARRLDAIAPAAVAFGTLGTRRGDEILADPAAFGLTAEEAP